MTWEATGRSNVVYSKENRQAGFSLPLPKTQGVTCSHTNGVIGESYKRLGLGIRMCGA